MAHNPIGPQLLGVLKGANMNTVADQPIAIALPPSATKYAISKFIVTNASTSLTLAVGGFYTTTSKGGTAIVANTQVYSGLTGSTKVINPAIAVTDVRTETTLYFALTTALGSAATADIYIIGDVLA